MPCRIVNQHERYRVALRAPLRLAMFVGLACLGTATACDDDDDDGDDSADDGNEDDGADVPDPVCDDLLTTADFEAVCGTALTLVPTDFEGIEFNPCNRTASGDDAILLVTRHANADTAASAADVAGGRGPTHQEGLGLYASAGSRSVFAIEVKASDESDAPCQPDHLVQLLDLALDRVVD